MEKLSKLEENIVAALKFFGPLNSLQLREKLEARGIPVVMDNLWSKCQGLIEKKQIREATGFPEVTWKI